MAAAAAVLAIVRPLTVGEFHQMIDAKILDPEERVELIEGVIVQRAAQKSPHASLSSRIARMLWPLELQRAALVRQEKAVVLGDHDELYPDISVVRFREDDYAAAHPTAAETLLIVEVSDTTLTTDRRVKLPRYARAGIPEVWIANIPGRRIEVQREPSRGKHRVVQTVAADAGSKLCPAAFPQLELDVAEMFRFV